MNVFPVPTRFPSTDSVYQEIVPSEATAETVTSPISQTDPFSIDSTEGFEFTVSETGILADEQPFDVACA